MVVSNPREIDMLLQQVPCGAIVTLNEIRQHLAKRYQTDIACPVSTAIYINIAAAAAEEIRAQGSEQVTPYWRALKPNGKLNEKYPGGLEAQKRLLEAEGFNVVRSKGGYAVADYEQYLFRW